MDGEGTLCILCGYKAKSKEQLSQHVYNKHHDDKENKEVMCEECFKIFKGHVSPVQELSHKYT